MSTHAHSQRREGEARPQRRVPSASIRGAGRAVARGMSCCESCAGRPSMRSVESSPSRQPSSRSDRIEYRRCKSSALRSRSGATPGRPAWARQLVEYAARSASLISCRASSTMRSHRAKWMTWLDESSTLMLYQRLPLFSGRPRMQVHSQNPRQGFLIRLRIRRVSATSRLVSGSGKRRQTGKSGKKVKN